MKVVNNVREASYRIALLLDTKGSEIRTVKNNAMPIEVSEGDIITVFNQGHYQSQPHTIEVSFNNFSNEIPEKENVSILIGDGDRELKIREIKSHSMVCEAMSNREIKGKKSVNVPGSRFSLPSLTEKDKGYIHFAIENNLDFIALCFFKG